MSILILQLVALYVQNNNSVTYFDDFFYIKGRTGSQCIKMNELYSNFLLARDKFMPKMHLKQPGFTYKACGPFTKNKERIQKFKETGDISYIYKNELDKACFQHDMAYGHYKDLKRRTASDKILRDKAFNIAKNCKSDGYQRGLASMVYNFFDQKSSGSGIVNNNNNNNNNHHNNNNNSNNDNDIK